MTTQPMSSTVQQAKAGNVEPPSQPLVVDDDVMSRLPAAVQRYLRFAGAIGRCRRTRGCGSASRCA